MSDSESSANDFYSGHAPHTSEELPKLLFNTRPSETAATEELVTQYGGLGIASINRDIVDRQFV